MSVATVTTTGTDGFWFAADNETRESIFIHISQVEGNKWLHLDDEIEYTLGINPKSGKPWATDVKITYAAPYRLKSVKGAGQ